MSDRFYARCANDRDPEFPNWIVCDRNRGGINGMVVAGDLVGLDLHGRIPVASRSFCEWLAKAANASIPAEAAHG